MINIDLKLLAIVNELNRTRSVSHAAENLAISHSTVSMSLARLRKYFGDPLFVRTSTGMQPTPRASDLIGLLKKADDYIQLALNRQANFDPKTSDRMFRLCSTDIGQLRLLPALINRLTHVAPSVRIRLRNITEDTPKLLESGEADLAWGFIPPMGAGFCQQRLFKERFVCAVRTGHPRIKNELTLAQFQAEGHVAVTISGTGHSVVEKLLEKENIIRRVSVRVPSFLGVSTIIGASDLLCIVPEHLGLIFKSSGNIRLFNLPFNTPAYFIRQHWHERYSHDSGHKWLRNIIAEIMAE
ncbi:MAG TPA: LysR family transcriptional regulator [Bryobacteraceae bacterium]|nr:LysR family transcriptional regulator [Bryobacteraceae bacterium]